MQTTNGPSSKLIPEDTTPPLTTFILKNNKPLFWSHPQHPSPSVSPPKNNPQNTPINPPAPQRRVNNLPSDHLLAARRTLLIPGTHYRGGVSLSPRPVEGEAEEARKAKIRRFMVTCKASEYDVAVFYLEQAGYDFSAAVETFFADEAWEREHPIAEGADRRSRGRGKGTVGGGGGWFARKPK